MADSAYAAFIEDCRAQRAALIGLMEAIEGMKINPGAPIAIPPALADATATTVEAFEKTVAQLSLLVAAYDALPDPSA